MIIGKNIYLRLMEMADVPHKVRWVNDDKVRKTLSFNYPISVVGTEAWLRTVCIKDNRRDFIVCLRDNDQPIGYAGLLNIDVKNRKSESYLGIGEVNMWGKGLGLDIKVALLKYAFDELNLNKVYSYHHENNFGMIKINEKVGGVKEGLIREDLVMPDGNFINKVLMSVLKSEFRENL